MSQEPCQPPQEMVDAIGNLAERFKALPDKESQSVALLLCAINGAYLDCASRDLLDYIRPFVEAKIAAIDQHNRRQKYREN